MNFISKLFTKKRLVAILGVVIILILAAGLIWFNRDKLFSGASTNYKSVSDKTALTVAKNWLSKNPAPMTGDVSGQEWKTKNSRQLKNKNNQTIAHIIDLEPQGYIIVPAYEEIEPVLAFSTESDFDNTSDDENHLLLLLTQDIPDRLKNQDKIPSAYKKSVSEHWGKLKKEIAADSNTAASADTATSTTSLAAVTPVVSPMIATRWNQGSINGVPAYNYYTPNNYLTGCVATATAQVMNYYRYPSHAAFTNYVYVNSLYQSASVDSTYDYDNMPLQLTSASPLIQTQSTGRLLADVGAGLGSNYAPYQTVATMSKAATTLTNFFGYGSAQFTLGSAADWSTVLKNELNGGHPVPLGIADTIKGVGHAVVADGWGTDGLSDLYHFNMGWSGNYDAWYTLPGFTTGSNNWNALSGLISNIRITAPVDAIAPTVVISSPANDEIVAGTTNIAATALDNKGVTKVEFYQNSNLIATDTTLPYNFNWDTSGLIDGPYILLVKAYDAAGNIGVSSPVNITVSNTRSVVLPTANITSPLSGSAFSRRVKVTITAAATGENLTKVEFYASGSLVCTDTATPYTCSWNTGGSRKTYSLSAKVYDAAGNSAVSSAVGVTVK